jgi:hypothetical protein
MKGKGWVLLKQPYNPPVGPSFSRKQLPGFHPGYRVFDTDTDPDPDPEG